jgi:hypothetical protein
MLWKNKMEANLIIARLDHSRLLLLRLNCTALHFSSVGL